MAIFDRVQLPLLSTEVPPDPRIDAAARQLIRTWNDQPPADAKALAATVDRACSQFDAKLRARILDEAFALMAVFEPVETVRQLLGLAAPALGESHDAIKTRVDRLLESRKPIKCDRGVPEFVDIEALCFQPNLGDPTHVYFSGPNGVEVHFWIGTTHPQLLDAKSDRPPGVGHFHRKGRGSLSTAMTWEIADRVLPHLRSEADRYRADSTHDRYKLQKLERLIASLLARP